MATHVFTVVLNRRPTDGELDDLFDAGLDDAAFGVEHGVPVVEFDRDAPALADAVASAVRALEAVGLVAVRVLDDDFVTLAE